MIKWVMPACFVMLISLVALSQTTRPSLPAIQGKWEYATLSFSNGPEFGVHFVSKDLLVDEAYDLNNQGSQLAKVYARLGGPATTIRKTDKGQPTVTNLDLINAAGLNGWELIYRQNGGQVVGDVWMFKRPLK